MLNRTYGIEIECLLPPGTTYAQVAAAITAAGVDCREERYNHDTRAHWKVISDGSLSGFPRIGAEVVAPPLSGEAGLEELRIVLDTLKTLNASVNKSCGLHIHIDARNQSPEFFGRLAALYARHERIIDAFLPASRRANSNQYCWSIASAPIERLLGARGATATAQLLHGASRYVKLNFTSFWRHGTVEFRHHSGTIEFDKARNWLLLCMGLYARAERPLDADFIGTAAQARTVRPGSKREIIARMVMQPGGATRDEICRAADWPSCNVESHCLAMGIAVDKTLEGRTVRYSARREMTAARPITFDTFCEMIELPETAKAFFADRTRFFASGTGADETERLAA